MCDRVALEGDVLGEGIEYMLDLWGLSPLEDDEDPASSDDEGDTESPRMVPWNTGLPPWKPCPYSTMPVPFTTGGYQYATIPGQSHYYTTTGLAHPSAIGMATTTTICPGGRAHLTTFTPPEFSEGW